MISGGLLMPGTVLSVTEVLFESLDERMRVNTG